MGVVQFLIVLYFIGYVTAIVGPDKELADPHEFPWYASVYNKGRWWCGATLVARDVVLVAAICLRDYDTEPLQYLKPKDAYVKLGQVYLDNDDAGTVQIIEVTRIVTHPGHNINAFNNNGTEGVPPMKHSNDVALLFLCEKAKLNKYVQVLPRLAVKADNKPIKDHGVCLIAGFGSTGWDENGDPIYPNVMYKANMFLANPQKCKSRAAAVYSVLKVDPRREVCTLDERQNRTEGCEGESGTALLCDPNGGTDWILYGMVSWGADVICDSGIVLHARMSYYRTWILRQIWKYAN